MKDGLGTPESDREEEEESLDRLESGLWRVGGTIEVSKTLT